ncbi:MAG: substrate-binding domain-containing protein [Verrucomicrobiales bacterium]
MRRRFILFLGIAVMGLAGCAKEGSAGGSSGNAERKLRIAVIPKGTTHEFWKSGEAGARKAGEEFGVEIIWKGPQRESDRAGQLKVVENFITQSVDGIALAPLDDKALVRPVKEAAAAGIKVAVWDSGLDDSAGDAVISFVATDNFFAGEECGRRLADLLGGKGKVIMLRHAVGHASTTKRAEGFLSGIGKAAPDIELVSIDQRGGTSIDEAIKTSENLLNQFGDSIQGVFTPNESTTQGMLRALDEAGLAGKVAFVGFDTNDTLLSALRDKKISALAVQDPFRMGYTAVKNIVAAINGGNFEAKVDTGAVLLDLDNIDSEKIRKLLRKPAN